MKTSILTMVMIVLTSLNINAKTNGNSWRNTGKNNNTVVVVNENHGRHDAGCKHCDKRHFGMNGMHKHEMDRRHHDMHRHDCILVKDSKKTYVCRVCGKHYKETRR